jgi:hypothetical protein
MTTEQPGVTPLLHLAVTLLTWDLVQLHDMGARADISEVRRRVNDGSVFPWLRKNHQVTNVPADRQPAILQAFRGIAESANDQLDFGVSQNGLTLLLAWCIELYARGRGTNQVR